MADQLTISRKNFVQMIGQFTGYPNPDDPGDPNNPFGPYGPHGPVIHQLAALQRLHRIDQVAGWPQPIPPPKALFAISLSHAVIQQVAQLYSLADQLPADIGNSVRDGGNSFLDDFDKWCGTMTRSELIQELLRKILKKKPFPEPPPEPWWNERMNPSEIVRVGVQLQLASEQISDKQLAGAFEQNGNKLMENGLSMMG
jgi:hypothetical protein